MVRESLKASRKSSMWIVTLLVGLCFAVFFTVKPAEAYAGTNLFADPPTFSTNNLRIGDKFNFTICLENRTKVTTIAFSLQFNINYVNITRLIPNPTNDLPGGVSLIGDWYPNLGRIEAITYGILGGSWDVTLARVWTVEVQIMGFTPPGGTVIDIFDMDCYDEYMYNFLSGDSPYDITVYHTFEYIVHPVVVDTTTYYVTTESNSSVTNFNFNQTGKSLYFNVSGASGTKGFVNVTIPKALLDVKPEYAPPNDWLIFIDGNPTTFTKTENATHTSLYITYTHTQHQIEIKGNWVVPEFPTTMSIFLILVLMAIIVTFSRKLYISEHERIAKKR
jgi:hypothetical protein